MNVFCCNFSISMNEQYEWTERTLLRMHCWFNPFVDSVLNSDGGYGRWTRLKCRLLALIKVFSLWTSATLHYLATKASPCCSEAMLAGSVLQRIAVPYSATAWSASFFFNRHLKAFRYNRRFYAILCHYCALSRLSKQFWLLHTRDVFAH